MPAASAAAQTSGLRRLAERSTSSRGLNERALMNGIRTRRVQAK
jgi:hypothetical protein